MTVTRREFILGAGTALAASGWPTGFPAIAQRRVFKVGVFISEVDAQGIDERVEPYVAQMRVGLGLAASEVNGPSVNGWFDGIMTVSELLIQISFGWVR